jgi:DhnA family fructose-bisphosphate aldolase class Ia
VVKTAFPTGASADEFKAIVDACFVPVIVLGGAAMGDDRALLEMVRKAMDAGASGIAVGRNVWQHPNPPKIAAALNAIVHGVDTVDSALKLVR